MSQHTRRARAVAATTRQHRNAGGDDDDDASTTAMPPCTVAEVGAVLQRVHRSAAHAQRCKKELLSLLLLPPPASPVAKDEDNDEQQTQPSSSTATTTNGDDDNNNSKNNNDKSNKTTDDAAADAPATTTTTTATSSAVSAPRRPRPGGIESVCAVVLLVLQQVSSITADALRRHYSFLGDLCRAYRDAAHSDALSVALLQAVQPYHNANDKAVRLAVVTTLEVVLRTVDQSNTSDARQDLYQDLAERLKQRMHDRCPHVRERAVAAAAAFQTGKRDCDVTAQLVALLCSDTHGEVRRQILRGVAPRKEFLEGYFHALVRSTRDVVARVRGEAWDGLGRFAWRYIVAYAVAKRVSLLALLHDGLRDHNASVVVACTATLTSCWLHRDCRDDCTALLEPVVCGSALADLDAVDAVCAALLTYCRRRTPQRRFALALRDVHMSSLLMWRAECLLYSDVDGVEDDEAMAAAAAAATATSTTRAADAGTRDAPAGDTSNNNDNNSNGSNDKDGNNATSVWLLPPLETFAALLQDTMHAYAKPDVAATVVRFRSTDDADNMLRVVLATVDLYDDNGYLAHADNTTRHALLRQLSFLLKVVPDDAPWLFVEPAVRAVKALTTRTPDEATHTVTSALDSLFRSLRLPQRYGLGFDDLEALGRKSRERQQELARRKARLVVAAHRPHDERRALTSTSTTAAAHHDVVSSTNNDDDVRATLQRAYDELRDELDRDEKFLLRMQHMVLAYLSLSLRGDAVPPFCSHVIQLGRQQDSARVRAVATRSLGLMCMVQPETVHTFVPLLYADAHDHTATLPLATTTTTTTTTTAATTMLTASDARVVAAAESVPVAALGALFDLVMEYGLAFFDAPSHATTTTITTPANDEPTTTSTTSMATAAALYRNSSSAGDASLAALDARLQREHDVADEDVHKVGGTRLLRGLLACLALPRHTATATTRNHHHSSSSGNDTGTDHNSSHAAAAAAALCRVPVALVGFCKLLSCNRVPSERVPLVLAMLTLHRTRAYMTRKSSMLTSYTCDYLTTFLRSYAASHTRRQGHCVTAAVAALRALVCHDNDNDDDDRSHNNDASVRRRAWALALMQHMTRITDAFVLTHIRDIDPDVARHVAAASAAEASSAYATHQHDAMTTTTTTRTADGNAAARGDGSGGSGNTTSHNTTARATATRSSMQSGRLLRELSRCSLHEQLACELLVELAVNNAADARGVCLEVLERYMYFYAKDAQLFLAYCADRALAALSAAAAASSSSSSSHDVATLHTRLQAWVADVRRCSVALPSTLGSSSSNDDNTATTASLEEKWQACLRQRSDLLDELHAAGFDAHMVCDDSDDSNSSSVAEARAGHVVAPAPAASAKTTTAATTARSSTAPATAAAARVKGERVAVKRERDDTTHDYFDVESIVRTRTARPRR